MDTSYLDYELQDGYIHNWLVAGPQEIAVSGAEGLREHDRKLQIAHELYEAASGIVQPPVEGAVLKFSEGELTWRYVRCLDDHFVDQSVFHHEWHYLRSWAYTQVSVWEEHAVTLTLTTNGPADVWLNGEHVHRQEHFHHQQPHSVTFNATLRATTDEGLANEILVRFEEVAARECPYVMALHIAGVEAEDAEIRVSTTVARTARRLMYERAFEYAYLEEVVNYKGAAFNLRWSEDLPVRCNYTYHIMDILGRTHIDGSSEAVPGAVADVGHGYRLWERPYRVVLRAIADEYYKDNIRYQWEMPLQVLDTPYVDKYDGAYEARRQESLKYAAGREGDLFAEIAKMALGQWDKLALSVIDKTLTTINHRGDCSDFYLTGLLGMMYRYMADPAFPEALKSPLKACVLNFKYWRDEPGADAMCYTTENHSILFHTCEVLAGQLYPEEVFSNTGQTGAWHREKGERLALDWLSQRGAGGFQEWDSNCYFDEDLLALSHLADLAEDTTLMELAAVVMDKLLFTMALNSYKGVFGSTHGRTYAPMIKGAQLEATSGISRLLFGLGVYNPHLRGLVSLACSEYEVPAHFVVIATAALEEMWSRERHIGAPELWAASGALGPEVNKVTYRTPDYMLCSAQDYHPGERGYQQHIWQATLSQDAVVFVNHPACMSENGAHRPNFWCGNFILPRVAQWKDTLVAIHKASADDWMGFTHAYFPIYAFDAYTLTPHWAFARKGDGYLALFAAQGLELVKRGPSAYRELRSHGAENVWVCAMGRAALDGSFEAFQAKVLALDVCVEELTVRMATLRGPALTFGWEGPLTLDGVPQPITGFKHYENPYCVVDFPVSRMEILVDGYVLALDFSLAPA
ncbi:MAG TPA: hypothetical protein PKH77_06760 [Anaerolineae bacterium]|nr:hypothetical protein [Anaerolineae bacterium]